MVKLVFLVILLVVLLQAQGRGRRRRCPFRCRCPRTVLKDIFINRHFGKKNHMLQFCYIQIKLKKRKDTTLSEHLIFVFDILLDKTLYSRTVVIELHKVGRELARDPINTLRTVSYLWLPDRGWWWNTRCLQRTVCLLLTPYMKRCT